MVDYSADGLRAGLGLGQAAPVAETNSEPNELERRLIEAVVRGALLDLAGSDPVDDDAMQSWDTSREIRSWVLRDIVRGRLVTEPDPRGLRLRGARITGQLDLENVTRDLNLALFDCFLPDGLVLQDARLFKVDFSGCRIGQPLHSTDGPIAADRFTARVMWLDRAVITADSPTGAVRLLNAHLGLLECNGAKLSNTAGPALHADGLQVDQAVYLRDGFTATGAGELGAVRLLNAHLGRLDCDGARLSNTTGPALAADGLQVDQAVFLRDGFTASDAGERGAVRLLNAHLGRLECNGAKLSNTTGPALAADGLQVDQAVFLRDGFTASGAGERGAVRLLNAHLGLLECDGAKLSNTAGPALHADGLQVDQAVFLRDGFTATAASKRGAVRLLNAQLGRLDFNGARLINTDGLALLADSLRVDRGVFMRDGFTASGAGKLGAIRLLNAHLGQLDCRGAKLSNTAGLPCTLTACASTKGCSSATGSERLERATAR
ncbi:hypothetical protein [Nucisporomicrobium flavum]|uniref:hypothetical protein n=1 Tax=Nucisporomicrobium flavum TaxID=2785915 RepID=UPI0018F687C7|nr:hypothetical protein [Nucisporomicrobium flavum]